MNQNKLTKMLSTGLSLALAVSSMPLSVGAVGPEAMAPAFVSKLTPPEQFGYVASSFAPNGEEKPRLIILADLHAHVEVQRNLMGLLSSLVGNLKTAGKKVPIFLEGGWESNLEEPLRKVSNPSARHFMDEYYLLKAEMGGPQAYSEKIAGSNQITMIGVEDKEEYLANKSRFAKTYPVRKQLLEAIKMQEIAMQMLSNTVEASSYKKLQQFRDDYNLGRVPAEHYAKVLVKYADRYHIDGRYVSVLNRASTASPEDLDIAFNNVYRQVSERLSSDRPLSSYFRQQMGNEPIMRENLALIDADLDLLKRLVSNQLTPSEVTLAMSRIGALIHTAQLLLQNQPVTVNVADAIRQSLDFYPLAFLRDETLAKNSLAHLNQMDKDTTGILVAGGFHVDAIASYLREHHISYMVIDPTITRDLTTEEQLNYVKRMNSEHVTPQEVAADISWLDSHQSGGGISAGVPITSAKENIMGQTGDKTPTDEGALFGGLKNVVRKNLDAYADKLATIGLYVKGEGTVFSPDPNVDAKEISKRVEVVQKNVNQLAGRDWSAVNINESLPGVTLHFEGEGANGRYVQVGLPSDHPQTVFEQTYNAALVELPKGTVPREWIYVQSVNTRDMLLNVGAESRQLSVDASASAVPIALDRFLQLQSIDNGTANASQESKEHALIALSTLAHEAKEAVMPRKSEGATTSYGYSAAAIVAKARFGTEGVRTLIMSAPAHMAFGKEVSMNDNPTSTNRLAESVAGLLAPKETKIENVSKIAELVSKEIVTENPQELNAEMEALKGSMEYNLARMGYSAPLLRRLREQLAAKLAQAASA